MHIDFFCDKCGMIRTRCTCTENKLETPEATGITSEMLGKIRKMHPQIDEEILENFPFPEPRKGQLEIIKHLKEAIDDNYKYLILEAGTGTGKSAIATTLARIYEPTYILTMTKQLQSQYAQQFGFPQVKGRGNFNCKEDDLESTCDMGTCQTTPSSQKFACPYGISKSAFAGASIAFRDAYGNPLYFRSTSKCQYWDQKATAANSSITLMNYDYALLELNYVKHFGKRKLMILDEAHNLEDKLMKRLEVNLYNRALERDIQTMIPPDLMRYDRPEEWILFIESISESYQEINVEQMPKNKAERIGRTKRMLLELLGNLEQNPDNWVVDTLDGGISFKPVEVNIYAPDRLFRFADVSLFMSATILDPKLFCEWLGIDPADVYYMPVPSIFPASRRPVHLKLAGNMSRRLIRRTAPKTIPILKKIIQHHKHDKGLIHTHNYKCQQFIMDKLKDPRLISHKSLDRERILQKFEESDKPLILVSPSMSEGVDLPYEKCQFQVIYKIPFPYLGDRQVNRRKEKDPRWYAYKTVMTLLQAYGRGMRAEDDYCETYILDGNIRMLFRSPLYRPLVPNFFKEAIVRGD